MDSLVVETRGRGMDLVMLHGWGMHSGIWGRALDLLEPWFRLHLVDLPGHGRNRGSVRDVTADMAPGAVAQQLLKEVPRGSAWLGWSLGGIYALQAAILDQTRIRTLILVATTPCFIARGHWPHGMAPETFRAFYNAFSRDYDAALRRLLALEVVGSVHARQALRELKTAAFRYGYPDRESLVRGLAILRETDLSRHLPRITRPSLLIAGERDRMVDPKAMTEMAGSMRRAALQILSGAGHAPFIGRRDDFCEEIRAFAYGS